MTMTREEAIKILRIRKEYVTLIKENILQEAIDMAIEALSEDISEDGTLKVNVSDASKVKRVMVWGKESGGLYYLDEECDKCKYFPFSRESNVQKMHDGVRPKGK
jgi:hypothetical protein